MIENFSNEKTPVAGEKWKKLSEEDRINSIYKFFQENVLYKDFKVIKAPDNCQIVLQIEQLIPAHERGVLLLDLETALKKNIDQAITVWCEPIGDKSKLRQLRGVKIKT
jgi:hypothetical protein